MNSHCFVEILGHKPFCAPIIPNLSTSSVPLTAYCCDGWRHRPQFPCRSPNAMLGRARSCPNRSRAVGSMSRSVRMTLLCEDKQRQVFALRFLKALDWNLRDWKLILSPAGRGSGEQFVRETFPDELRALRSKGRDQVYLVVLIDGDSAGVNRRREQIREACRSQGVQPPTDNDRVLVCAPTWNIETWLAYLAGVTIDETRRDYSKFKGRESQCQPLIDELARLCREGALREPAPPSLAVACQEFRRVLN